MSICDGLLPISPCYSGLTDTITELEAVFNESFPYTVKDVLYGTCYKWDTGYIDKIFDTYNITDKSDKDKVYQLIENFRNSESYEKLLKSRKKYFEFPFEVSDSRGAIDLLFYDEEREGWIIVDFKTGKEHDYSYQLNEYKNAMESLGLNIIDTQVLYLQN